ncbi:MAG: flippase-like domain-containing protein [Bernardetiaceae bacterium]|nr:flippase-like domain-containing protein [Bernardetiaceae bacterium]
MLKYLRVFVTILLFIGIYYVLDFNLAALDWSQVDILILLLAVLLPNILNPLIVNSRTKIFLSVVGIQECFMDLMRITYLSFFYGFLLPSSNGLDGLRIYFIEKRHRELLGRAGAAILMERILGILVLVCIAIVSLFVVDNQILSQIWLPVLLTLGSIATVLLLIFVPTWYYFFSKPFRKLKWLKSVFQYVDALLISITKLRKNKKIFYSLPLIAALQISNIILVYLLFLSFGIQTDLLTHFLFMPIIQILSLLPISINGFGLREGAYAFFYGFVGVSVEWSVMVSVLYFVILMGIPACVGGVLSLFSDLKPSRH